jgi:actin-related protein
VQVQPSGHRLLVTDPPLNPRQNQTMMLEVMLEKFGFQALSLQSQPVLALYSQGGPPGSWTGTHEHSWLITCQRSCVYAEMHASCRMHPVMIQHACR